MPQKNIYERLENLKKLLYPTREDSLKMEKLGLETEKLRTGLQPTRADTLGLIKTELQIPKEKYISGLYDSLGAGRQISRPDSGLIYPGYVFPKESTLPERQWDLLSPQQKLESVLIKNGLSSRVIAEKTPEQQFDFWTGLLKRTKITESPFQQWLKIETQKKGLEVEEPETMFDKETVDLIKSKVKEAERKIQLRETGKQWFER